MSKLLYDWAIRHPLHPSWALTVTFDRHGYHARVVNENRRIYHGFANSESLEESIRGAFADAPLTESDRDYYNVTPEKEETIPDPEIYIAGMQPEFITKMPRSQVGLMTRFYAAP